MILVDRLAARALAERQVAATFMAAGARGVVLPDVDEAIAEFDAALESGEMDADRQLLLEALGVRHGG